MKLNLTEEQRNNVKITYESNLFKVNFGKTGSLSREYDSVDDMMDEFHENKIQSADFDDEAHRIFNEAFKR